MGMHIQWWKQKVQVREVVYCMLDYNAGGKILRLHLLG